MKARKFWAIYIAVVVLGLSIFYAAADSIEEMPFALSETEMQHIQGGEYNVKCVDKTGCPWSGCTPSQGLAYYVSTGNSWKDCTYSSGDACNLQNQTKEICKVTYHSEPGCISPMGSGSQYGHRHCY